MDQRMFRLSHSLEEYVCPSILTVGALCFVFFWGFIYLLNNPPTYPPTHLEILSIVIYTTD
jgi:hypothetical protein